MLGFDGAHPLVVSLGIPWNEAATTENPNESNRGKVASNRGRTPTPAHSSKGGSSRAKFGVLAGEMGKL